MKKLLFCLLAFASLSGFARCYDLERPMRSLSIPGVRGVMAMLPYAATKVCISHSNGFMGGEEDTTWKVTLKDSDGYMAAIFYQDTRPDGNASRVFSGRCASYCKTVIVDNGKYFDGRQEVSIARGYLPLQVTVRQTSMGSSTARVEFASDRY